VLPPRGEKMNGLPRASDAPERSIALGGLFTDTAAHELRVWFSFLVGYFREVEFFVKMMGSDMRKAEYQ
jgi:hypothetical protein